MRESEEREREERRSEEDDSALLAQLLAGGAPAPRSRGALAEASVASWGDNRGVLHPATSATLAPSCLIVPRAGDSVLAWTKPDSAARVLAVLARAEPGRPGRMALEAGMEVEATTLAVRAQTLTVSAGKMISHAQAHHIVEDTRTEAVRMRVADIEEDVRRARNAHDEVSGTLLQRAGAWFNNVAREIRVHARTTLFD